METETRMIIYVILGASLIGLLVSMVAIYLATKEVENGRQNWGSK